MKQNDIDSLLVRVRGGSGLKQAVKGSGLHVRNTLIFLRDSEHRETFKEAKEEANELRALRVR